jgi:hypothetical protein
MKKTTNGNGVTVANLFTVLGIILLAFLLYIGYSLMGLTMSMNIIYTLGIVIGFSLLVWMLSYAKGIDYDRHFTRWIIIECVVFIAYIAGAVYTSKPILQTVAISSNTDEIQAVANEDNKRFVQLIEDFQTNETDQIDRSRGSLENLYNDIKTSGSHIITGLSDSINNFVVKDVFKDSEIPANDVYLEKLYTFISSEANSNFGRNHNDWKKDIENINLGDQRNLKTAWEQAINESQQTINSWNLLKMQDATAMMSKLETQVPEILTEISTTSPFHVLNKEDSYVLERYQGNSYSLNFEVDDVLAKVKEEKGWMGIGIVIGIHILILMSYIFAYRSKKVAIKRQKNLYGQVLE